MRAWTQPLMALLLTGVPIRLLPWFIAWRWREFERVRRFGAAGAVRSHLTVLGGAAASFLECDLRKIIGSCKHKEVE